MDHELRDIRHRARPVALLLATRHPRHEITERLGIAQQLAQLHANPRRIDDAHVERQQLAQTVQRSRITARHPHRVRPALAGRQHQFFQDQHEIVAGTRVEYINRPRHGAVSAGLRFFFREQGVQHGRAVVARRQAAELLHAPVHDAGKRSHGTRHVYYRAVGWHRAIESVVAGSTREDVELRTQPRAILRAHVHRQRLGDSTQSARLFVAVDPDFKGVRIAVIDVAHENRELPGRRFDHVSPRRIARGHLRPAGPAQARQRRHRRSVEVDAAVGVGCVEVVRRFYLRGHGKH